MSIDQQPESSTTTPIALHFGAGNIGRGFIGAVLSQAGLRVIFADTKQKFVDTINEQGKYNLHVLGGEEDSTIETINNVGAILSMDDKAIEEVARQSLTLVTTAVGPSIIPKLGKSIAVIVRARMADNLGPVNVVACENLQKASEKLRDATYSELSDEEKEFADRNFGFAVCSVDRIVPPFDGETESVLDVGVEPFYEWNVDSNALKKTEPHCEIKGMRTTSNLDAYVQRKLFTLNCGHAITAFLGALPREPHSPPSNGHAYAKSRTLSTTSIASGAATPLVVPTHPTIMSAINDPPITSLVKLALDQSGQALIRKHGFTQEEHDSYVKAILDRFRNPHMHDEVARVGREPLRKLKRGDRLLGPIELCREYGINRDGLLTGVASALLFHPRKSTRRKSSTAVSLAGSRRGSSTVPAGSAGGSRKNSSVLGGHGGLLNPLAQLRLSLQQTKLQQNHKEESAIIEDDYYEYEYEDEEADPQAKEVNEMIAEKGLVPVILELTGWQEDDEDVKKIVTAYEVLKSEGVDAAEKAAKAGLDFED